MIALALKYTFIIVTNYAQMSETRSIFHPCAQGFLRSRQRPVIRRLLKRNSAPENSRKSSQWVSARMTSSTYTPRCALSMFASTSSIHFPQASQPSLTSPSLHFGFFPFHCFIRSHVENRAIMEGLDGRRANCVGDQSQVGLGSLVPGACQSTR